MRLFPRSILTILIVTFTLNFGLVNKAHADETLDTILNTLSSLTCETQGIGDLLRTEFSQTCIVAPFFTFAIMNLVSPILYMNTFLKLKINDDELFGKQFPGGQCIRENRADSTNPELTFGLCSNAKLALVRVTAIADSTLAIAKAVLTGTDPWDDIKASWANNEADYYDIYTGKPGDSGMAFDIGFPVILWKVIQNNDRICVATPGFTGYVPVGCKYIKEPFPKSMYNNFMDVSDTGFSDGSNIQPTDPTALVSCSSAGGGCYQTAYNASKTAVVMTSPLIECIRQMIARLLISQDVCSFDDVNQVINSASRQTSSLFQFQVKMYKIVTAFLTLYVIFFGFKILLAGEIPPKTEYINFILKIIFVTYFSIGLNITPGNGSPYDRMDGMIQWAFPFLLNGINGLASWVMNAAPSDLCKFNGPNISYDSSMAYIALWDALDCRVAHYLGLDMLSTLLVENTYRSHDFANFDFFSFSAPPYLYLLIPAIISGNMMLISLALSYPLLVISVAAFMVNATVMCMISIVILGILAPLFVPMFLFSYTRNYFDSWVKLMISFLLQPMVVVTFMITMFSVYDYGFYGKCKYDSKLIHNSIENMLESGSTSSRDVLIFYINNDWTQYTKEEANSCQNSLGYMLNNPISTAFNFAKNTVEQIVTSKPGETCNPNASSSSTTNPSASSSSTTNSSTGNSDTGNSDISTLNIANSSATNSSASNSNPSSSSSSSSSNACNPKPGGSSTSAFLSKFEFLAGIVVGPGMFFTSAKLIFEKIKDVLLALVTACFTLYLMYNFSSQLADFAADMTEGVSLSSVAIKPQAIFKAAMAGLAAAGGAAAGAADKAAVKGGGGRAGDLVGNKGGRMGGRTGGDLATGKGGGAGDKTMTSGGGIGSSIKSAIPSPSSVISSGVKHISSSVKDSISSAATPNTGSQSQSQGQPEQQSDTSNNRKTIETPITISPTMSSTKASATTTKTEPSKVSDPKISRNTAEDKIGSLGKINTTKEAVPESKKEESKEPQVKNTEEIKPGPDSSSDPKTQRTARGLANDRVFNEQESHELKQGEAGYAKQEIKNAEIRDKKVAFEKETEELYRSGGGRAKDTNTDKQADNTEIKPGPDSSNDPKTQRTARGLADDRVFNEQESHDLKQGDLGYVKQEMKNTQIRDKKVAFEKETEELYRSGGGRAKDTATAKEADAKTQRNDGTIESRSKKIDNGSNENS